MSFNNNNYTTAPTSPNPYISRKINNMDQALVMKREREDWTRLYHKTLKGLEMMINIQRMAKDIKKLAEVRVRVGEATLQAKRVKLRRSWHNS